MKSYVLGLIIRKSRASARKAGVALKMLNSVSFIKVFRIVSSKESVRWFWTTPIHHSTEPCFRPCTFKMIRYTSCNTYIHRKYKWILTSIFVSRYVMTRMLRVSASSHQLRWTLFRQPCFCSHKKFVQLTMAVHWKSGQG